MPGPNYKEYTGLAATVRNAGMKAVWGLQVAVWWLKGWLSVPGIYFILSKYGESYRRALAWCAVSILGYSLLKLPPSPHDDLKGYTPIYFSQVERTIRLFFQVFDLQSLGFSDLLFRLWSALLVAILFIALKRKLERRR